MNVNRHGIPVVVTPPPPSECINKKNHRPKLRFWSVFEAERYVAEVIPPDRRAAFRTYRCGGHYHLTTKPE